MNQKIIFFYVILSIFSTLIATHSVKYNINDHPSFFSFLPNNTQRIILEPPLDDHFYEQFAILNSQYLVVTAEFFDKEPGTILSLVDIKLGKIVDQRKTNPSTGDITPTNSESENPGFFCLSGYRYVSYFQVKNSKLEFLGSATIPHGLGLPKAVGYHPNLGLVINNNTSTLYFAPIPSLNQPFELTTCYVPINSSPLINSDISPNGKFLILTVGHYQQGEVLKVEVVKSETGFTCKKTFSRDLGTTPGTVLIFKSSGADGKGILVTEDRYSNMWFEVASIDYNIFEFTDNNRVRFEGHREVGLVQVADGMLVIRARPVIYLDGYDYFQFKIDVKSGNFELVSIQSRKNDTYSDMASNSDIFGVLTPETRQVDLYYFD